MSEVKATHGGSRTGAGRKKKAHKKQPYSLRLDSALIQRLKLIANSEIEKVLLDLANTQ